MSKYVLVPGQKALLSLVDSANKEKFFLVCLNKFNSNDLTGFFEYCDAVAWEKATQNSRPLSICSNQYILDVYNCLYDILRDREMEEIELTKEMTLSFRQC